MSAGTLTRDQEALRSTLADAELMAYNCRALDTRHLDFEYLHRAMPRASGENRLAAFAAMPPADQEEAWRALGQRRRDAHWLEGHVQFERERDRLRRERARRRTERQVARPKSRKLDLDRLLEQIRQIDAEDYLERLAGVEPRRGLVQCPTPDHEDLHPSASYEATVWHCHACQAGGDLLTLAELISGIPARGKDFGELLIWTADRLGLNHQRERIEAGSA